MVCIIVILAMVVVAAPGALGVQAVADPPDVQVGETPLLTESTHEEISFWSWEYWQQGGRGASRSEVFRNFGLLVIAVVGLGFGIWRAWTAHRQAIVAEKGLITDRFATAVEQLGNDSLSVRLGGIYSLWRLTEDAPKLDVINVLDVLCAFVRNPPVESFTNKKKINKVDSDKNKDSEASWRSIRI